LKFEPGLVERILEDAEQAPGCLPLLEFLLDRLWHMSLREGVVTNDSYTRLGGLEGAIASWADEQFGSLSAAGQAACGTLFRRLVHAGETVREDTRRRADMAVLPPLEQAVAMKLISARLLVSGGAAGESAEAGGKTVEVAHEELLRRWKQLKGWIEQDRGFLKWRRELDVQVAEYQKDRRVRLSGRRLSEARQFYPARKNELEPLERELLRRSFSRRWQWRLGTVGVIGLLFLSFAYSRAMNNVRTLLATPADRVQAELEELAPYRWLARWRLSQEMTGGKGKDRQRATLAMARFFPSRTVVQEVGRGWNDFEVEEE
ncbi:MAG: hypothetical protein ACKPJJ_06605, partial [Planctomycetaceae bacterium]